MDLRHLVRETLIFRLTNGIHVVVRVAHTGPLYYHLGSIFRLITLIIRLSGSLADTKGHRFVLHLFMVIAIGLLLVRF